MTDKQPEAQPKHDVRVHINQKEYQSPSPMTGEALYALGQVPHDHQLYREVQGDEEDEPIENGQEQIHLQQDEHFHSSEGHHKGFAIIINSREELVAKKRVSFEQLVALAYPTSPGGQYLKFTVAYYNGPKANPTGTLVEGETVLIKKRMAFDVKFTNRS